MAGKARTVKKLEGDELFQYAVSLLAGRALSRSEVRSKLMRKASVAGDVDVVLGRLAEYGYLDDDRFAESYASTRRDSGSFGQSRVLRDLRQRQVSSTVARKAVDAAFEEFDERAAVDGWLERKFRNRNLAEYLQDEKRLASAYRKLRYAGFSSAAAVAALKRYASRADELEDEAEEST